MPISQQEIDHLSGRGVVVKTYYADPSQPGVANVSTHLPDGDELSVWEDAAFTNGGPLVKIEIVWSPSEAQALREMDAPPAKST